MDSLKIQTPYNPNIEQISSVIQSGEKHQRKKENTDNEKKKKIEKKIEEENRQSQKSIDNTKGNNISLLI